ncbi:MAG: 3-deoxy-manno-octulosonate cytidylyltransferase [Bacteroidales bacterium]|jgi:3-deoxy-manno-octulosonate cytidylyltransferase (CMP-KDO synthetase)|nr:3-deoxy-manno-octulosonate cytidylyltransferase [Bacteroidales bacterium]
MKVFAIIPARYASTRFPGKPLAKIQGRSMIEWVYRRAGKVFETIAVATDDERIAGEVRRFGGNAVMTSSGHASGTDRCAEALSIMQEACGEQADVVVNIQGDEPFVDPGMLSDLAGCFKDGSVQIATVVRKIEERHVLFDPNCVKVVVGESGKALYFSRSPIPFLRGYEPEQWIHRHDFYLHLGVYAYRAEVLARLTRLQPSPLEKAESLEQNRWLENGCSIRVLRTDTAGSIAVDTPEDLQQALLWLKDHPVLL